MPNITDLIGPEQCSKCGTYGLCDCKQLIPTTPGKGKWDYECPGDDKCHCHDEPNNEEN